MEAQRSLQRKVSQLFRMRGLQLAPDAMPPLLRLLGSSSDWEAVLNLLLKELEKLPEASRCVTRSVVEQGLAASNSPEVTHHHTAEHAPEVHSYTHSTRLDRMRRNGMFLQARPQRGMTSGTTVELSRVSALLGRGGSHVLIGILTEGDAGSVAPWQLIDEDGCVPLNLSGIAPLTNGFFTPSSVVLVEGAMDGAVFRAKSMSQPPDDPCVVPDGLDQAPTSGMLLVFSDVWLDDPKVLGQLQDVLRGYDTVGRQGTEVGGKQVPAAQMFTFLFCGNFSSVQYSSCMMRSQMRILFRSFAELLGRFTTLRRSARFIFVPGPLDTSLGAAAMLQHAPLSETLCKDLRAVLSHCEFLGNPAGFTLDGQKVVVFAEEVLSCLKSKTLVAPRPDADCTQHLVETLLHQGHLCPLPSADLTSYTQSAFRLDPRPDLMILATRRAQFNVKHAETTVFNPGLFATTGKWMVYHTRDRRVESSACDRAA